MMPELNRIYQGDCLEIMKTWPDKCVDIGITSPPYNTMGKNIGSLSGMHKNNKFIIKNKEYGYADSKPESDYQKFLIDVVKEMMRVCKGLVWVNHKIRYRNGVGIHPAHIFPFDIYCEVIWNRGGTIAMSCKRYGPSHEVIYGFGSPHFWDDSMNTKMSVWNIFPAPQGFDHPCPFPVELIAPLIVSSCPQDGIVIDPFFGTGSTGIGAERLDRKWIGIELEPKYVAIAQSRIDAEGAQLKLSLG